MLYDLIVIGSGPAGHHAAIQGAKAGKKVAVIEQHSQLGGGCVHSGTLPSKSFRESVYRWSLKSDSDRKLPDMKRLLERCNRVVKSEAQVCGDQLKRNGVTVVHGKARITSPNEVSVTAKKGKQTIEEKLKASFIFIATGARPFSPPQLQADGKWIYDSNSILRIKKIPKTLAVLGAGIIGCEYASIFSMAGSRVFLIDRRHEILASVDREIVDHLAERFKSRGVEVILEVDAPKAEKGVVHLSNGRKLKADCVLVAHGRHGNTQGLGLDELGIDHDERDLIKVDRNYRTTVPNIYAVGDVIGPPALASTSMEQGRAACCHAFKLTGPGMSEFFPYGIYTIPEISLIGPSEEDLKSRKVDYVAGRAHYRELARGQIVGDRSGLLKLLIDRKSLKLLGVHIVGDGAADLVHIGQAVMALDGDATYFIRNVFNYPTMAEAYKTAAFHALNQLRSVTF